MEAPLVLCKDTEMPFRMLSPMYDKHSILIQRRGDNKIEQSTSFLSYMYGGLVKNATARHQILSDYPKGARHRALDQQQREKIDLCMAAIRTGMENKYVNVTSRKQLLATGKKRLIMTFPSYMSHLANNEAGVILMRVRDDIFEKERERIAQLKRQDDLTKVTYTYQVVRLLRSFYQDAVNDLSVYIGKSVPEILMVTGLDPSPILYSLSDISDQDVLHIINSNDDIASFLRKKYRADYNESVVEDNRNYIMAGFLNSKMKYGDEKREYQRFYNHFLQDINQHAPNSKESQAMTEFKNRLEWFYQRGMFQIGDTYLNKLKRILSEQDIAGDPVLRVVSPLNQAVTIVESDLSTETGDLIIPDDASQPLSMRAEFLFETRELTNALIPSIWHYNAFRLFIGLGWTERDAYQSLLQSNGFRDISQILKDYEYEFAKKRDQTLHDRLKQVLATVFSGTGDLARLLVATFPRPITVKISEDIDKMVELELDNRRYHLISENVQPLSVERIEEMRKTLTEKGMVDYLSGPEERQWILRQIDDIIQVVTLFRNYMLLKMKQEIGKQDIAFVMKELMMKCFMADQDLKTILDNQIIPDVTFDFRRYVTKQIGWAGKDMIAELWFYCMFIHNALTLMNIDFSQFNREMKILERVVSSVRENRPVEMIAASVQKAPETPILDAFDPYGMGSSEMGSNEMGSNEMSSYNPYGDPYGDPYEDLSENPYASVKEVTTSAILPKCTSVLSNAFRSILLKVRSHIWTLYPTSTINWEPLDIMFAYQILSTSRSALQRPPAIGNKPTASSDYVRSFISEWMTSTEMDKIVMTMSYLLDSLSNEPDIMERAFYFIDSSVKADDEYIWMGEDEEAGDNIVIVDAVETDDAEFVWDEEADEDQLEQLYEVDEEVDEPDEDISEDVYDQ